MKNLGDILMLTVAWRNVCYSFMILAKLGANTQICCNRTAITNIFQLFRSIFHLKMLKITFHYKGQSIKNYANGRSLIWE